MDIPLTSISLIVAGSETSATLLSGCIYYLCTTPKVLGQLTTEIRSTFAQDSEITFAALEKMEYLAAVIEESLRMYPPFVTSLARLVPTGGALVNGQYVPEKVCKELPYNTYSESALTTLDRQSLHVITTLRTTPSPTSTPLTSSYPAAG